MFKVTDKNNKLNYVYIQGARAQDSSNDIAGIIFQNYDDDSKRTYNMASIAMIDGSGSSLLDVAGTLLFKTNPDGSNLTERSRIDEYGNFMINTSNPQALFTIDGGDAWFGSNVRIQNTLVSKNAVISSITACNIIMTSSTPASFISLSASNIYTSNAYIQNLTTSNFSVTNVFGTTINGSNIYMSNASIQSLTASNVNAENATTNNMTTTNITASNFYSSNAYVQYLTASNIATTIIASTSNTASVTFTSQLFGSNVVALSNALTYIENSNINSSNATIINLAASNGYIASFTSSNINGTTASLVTLSASNLYSSNAYFQSMSASNSTIITLASSNMTASNALFNNSTTSNATIINSSNTYIAMQYTTPPTAGIASNLVLFVDSNNGILKSISPTNNVLAYGIFGSEYYYGKTTNLAATTSTTLQEKMRITTASIPAGTYRFIANYQVYNNANATRPVRVSSWYDTAVNIWHNAIVTSTLANTTVGSEVYTAIDDITFNTASAHILTLNYSSPSGSLMGLGISKLVMFRVS